MAKTRFKTKSRNIVAMVLVIATVLMIVGAISVSAAKTTNTISPGEFTRGSIDKNGEFVTDNTALCTKEAFCFEGLRVEPQFDANATYDIYYYDHTDSLVDVISGLNKIYDNEYPPIACKARIVIHPKIPDGVSEKDFKIKFYEVYGIASKLKITVNRDQKNRYENVVNLYKESEAQLGKTFDEDGPEKYVNIQDNTYMKMSKQIDITGEYEYYDVYVKRGLYKGGWLVSVIAAYDDNLVVVRESYNTKDVPLGEWCKVTLKVKDYKDNMYLLARMPADSTVYIFGYND